MLVQGAAAALAVDVHNTKAIGLEYAPCRIIHVTEDPVSMTQPRKSATFGAEWET